LISKVEGVVPDRVRGLENVIVGTTVYPVLPVPVNVIAVTEPAEIVATATAVFVPDVTAKVTEGADE
jgi:hypothetical protein